MSHHSELFNICYKTTECTLLQYSTTLSILKHSRIITSFWIIFNICYMMKQQYYIYIAEYSQYWFQNAVLNLITTRREFTLFQYSKTLSRIITSFWIIFNICYMMKQQYYIYIAEYSQYWFLPCCIEFNHYKTWMHSITVFYNTLKHNRIILQHDATIYISAKCCTWWMHSTTTFYIYICRYTPSVDFKQDVNLLFFSILKHYRT